MIKEKFDAIKAESGAKAVVFLLGTGRGTAPYMDAPAVRIRFCAVRLHAFRQQLLL